MRFDISGRSAPRWLDRLITGRYGRNPFGEPLFRLVWGPARFERSGGIWNRWIGDADPRQSPFSRQLELRWVRKYPTPEDEAWIIERWHDCSHYGSPDKWYAPSWDGGTILHTELGTIGALGDYPSLGDYEDIGARMYWYPTERHVTKAIDASLLGWNQLPATPRGRALRRTFLAREEQAKRDADYDDFAMDVLGDAQLAFHGAPMVGYGGSRRPAIVTLAERAGIRQHPL